MTIPEHLYGYHLADCMDILAQLPDKCIDLAIVDPPYKEDNSGLLVGFGRKHFNIREFKAPTKLFISEIFRTCKNWILWGANHYAKLMPNCDGFIYWHKHQNGHFAEGELAFTNMGKARFFDRAYQKDTQNKINPCQKPKALYRWQCENYATEKRLGTANPIILDTHVGSGNSLAVYEEFGFRYIATELDPDYYRNSLANIHKHRIYCAQQKGLREKRTKQEITLAGGQTSIFDSL